MVTKFLEDLKSVTKRFGVICLLILIVPIGGCSMRQIETLQIIDNSNLYSNPSSVNNIGDPFVLKASDGFYYMYCTSSENGYYCWKSADLVNWTDKKPAYLRQEGSWAVNCFWAPEVVELNGVYYMYYTAKNSNDSLRIGVAISSSPDGLFEDAKPEPLFDFGYAAIDANVLIDDDGKKYLYFSRDCSENIISGVRKSEIYGVSLNDDMISVDGEPVLLSTPSQPWEKGSLNPVWNEGPEVIKHNGVYYLTYSANYFASAAYSVGYATSDSPLGEYKKSDHNPILFAGSYQNISGPGHHSFTLSPDGTELFMVYHTHTFPGIGGGNRQVNIDRVIFTDNGDMYVNGPTISSQPMPATANLHNVSLDAKITLKDTEVPLLNDGIFTVHKKYAEFDWTGDVDENGHMVLHVALPKKKAISTIMIYRSVHAENDFTSAEFLIDNDYMIEKCELSSEKEDRALIANFEPIDAKNIKITLYPKDGNTRISLSEITVLGY